MALDDERIETVIGWITAEADAKIDDRLVDYRARMARNRGLGQAFIKGGLADLLAAETHDFFDKLAANIGVIGAGPKIGIQFGNAAHDWLKHLDFIYRLESQRTKHSKIKNAPAPDAWERTRYILEREIEHHRLRLEEKNLSRSPTVKKGWPPRDEAILAKADEMKERGMGSYEIAAKMRHEPGFENTGTTVVRNLIKGRWNRGPAVRTDKD